MLIAKCEHCGAVERVPDSYAGITLECDCGHDVIVPFPKPKTTSQPIVLFDPSPKKKHPGIWMSKKSKQNESNLVLPNDNGLSWVRFLHYFVGGLGIFSFVLLYKIPGSWTILAASLECFVVGTIIYVIGEIELNTRVNTKLLATILKQLENNARKEAK